ncbi:hypothetical protein ABPG74_005169 [Tetrahymena malaccensis]
MNTSEIQVGFVTKSFKQSYQSNKGSISKIFYENNQSLLYVSSLDGVLAVWNIVTQYNYKYLREYTFVNDSCRDFVLLQNKILAIVLQKSIVIFDISNENQKLIITQSDQSFIQQYSLYTNQKYILAYLDSCLRVIDINLKLLINKCQLQDVINAVISSQSIIYIQGQKFINVYSLDLTNQELVQQNQGITNAKNIQNFYLDENQPSGIQIVYFDFSIQKLFITDDQFNSIIQVQLNQVQQLITVKSFKDLNQQLWYFIVYKTNNYFVAAINQQSQIITKIYNMTSILGIYQIDCNINYNGQLIFYLTIASNSLSTPFLSTIKWNSYKNVGIIQQFLYNTEGSQITFVDQINQNNGLISVGSQNGFTGLNHDINFQNNYIYQIDQSDNNLIQQVSLSYQLNRIFIIKKTIIEYDLVLNSYIGEMKFDEPNLNQIEQIQGFQIQNDLRIILLFKSYQFIIKSYQNDIPQIYKLNNFGVIQNYYLNVSQKYLYVYGTKLSRFNLQLLEELVIISFLQYNKLIYQCIFPTGLIVCKYGDFSLVFLNSQDYSILKNFDVSGIEIGFNLTFDQQNNKLYLYKQSILTYTLAGQYLFSMNQQKQPIIEFKFCSDKIAILTAGNGYFYDRVSQTFLANFLSNQVGVFQKSIYIPNYNQLLFYSDYVQVGQISIFDLTQLILRGFLQLTFNTMVQIADFFFDESTQMLIIVNYQGNILAFNFQQSMNYNVLTIDDFENNHPIGFCVDYITNSLIVYNNNKVILINYALIAQKMQRNVDPIQFQTITKIDQFNNKKYILVDSTNIIYSYQNYTFSYQSYFQDQIKGIYQTQDQSVTLIYFLNYFIVYLNSNFDQIYFSNNNSYIVNGYRIYKFITDFIFLTIDNQVVHYDYLNNLVIFTFNIPFPQIIKSQLIQSDLILLGTSQGTIISYMISKKSMFTINLQSQYPIISILYTSSNYWFAQIDGSLNIYLTSGFNVLSQPIFNINIIDIIQSNQNTKLKAQLNLIILDEPQNRYFVQLSNSKVCIVIDMSTNLIIRNLMFPTDQISKIKITQNYVILLSTSQLNIHKRQDLIFQYQLKCNNVLDQIIDLIILYDQIYIISFTDKLQIYYFYQDILNFKLVDSMKLKFPIILNYNYDLVSTLLSIIGFSNQNIFEKKYWIKSFITNSPKCSSVVNGFTNVDVLKNINVLQAGNIILQQQQLLYLNLFDFTPVNFINQAQVSIILKPYDQLSSFNVNTQTFQSIQKDAYLKNFQLQFVEQGLFQFSNQTNKVFLQNISIKSQKISKIQIQFSKQSVVVIQNLIISDINDQVRLRLQTEKDSQNHNLTYRNLQQQNFSSFLAFQDCQTLIFFSGITNIYIKNLTVTQSQFQVMAKFQNIQNLTIENMFIKDNKAQQLQFQNPNQILQISGSLNTQISQDVILNITSDTVSQNNANIFGNNIGTYPVDIDITSDDKKENLIFTKTKNELVRYGVVEIFNYQSGSSTNFLISYIDSENRKIDFTPESVNNKMYPQIIIDEITSWLFQLESQDATLIQLTGQQQINYNQFDSINRCFRLENVYINANPNSNQQINLIYFISKYQQKNTIQLNIQLRQCIQGEIYKQFSKQIQICQSCVGGYYSIQVPQENQTSECQKCPNEAVTCDKNKLILKQGYWREQQIGQLNILLCDTLNNSCDESNLQNKYGCLQGYIGPLCEQCDYSGLIWGEKYSAYGYQKKCYSCSSNQTQIIVLTLSFLGLFFYITIQVYTFMKNFEVYLIQQYLRLSNILPISASQIGKLNSFYIKCLLNYIQLHQIIVDFELQWLPQSIFYISDFFGKPNSHIIVNLICIIPSYIINNNGVVDIVEKIGAEDLQITIDQNEQTMKLLKMNQEITSQLSQNAANSQNCIVFSPKKVKSFLNQFDNFNKQISIKQENDQDVKAIQTNQKDLILEISLQESKLDQINNEIQEHDGNKKNQINMQFNQMEFQKMENLVKNKITQS